MGPIPRIDLSQIAFLLDAALREDIGTGDITSLAILPPGTVTRGRFVARQAGVLAGGPLLDPIFQRIDPAVRVELLKSDGEALVAGDTLATTEGPAIAVLSGERVALNFLQRLSGVATLTRRYVEKAAPHGTRILDTRKTTPGWRLLEKHAVAVAGGQNHRMGLYDQVLIKDNHLVVAERRWPGEAIARAVAAARAACARVASTDRAGRKTPRDEPAVAQGGGEGIRIEVEADTLDQVRQALDAGADIILLDNMTLDEMREAVALARARTPRPILEASGGVTEERVAAIAATGVDWISVGALTHSAPALDIALDFETTC